MPQAKPPFQEVLRRAWRLRCPNCGRGRLFAGWIRMLPRCPQCRLAYFRESGYFIGAMIIDYGVASILVTAVYLALLPVPNLTGFSVNAKIAAWLGFAIVVSLGLMRHSYSFWLALDFWIEPWEPA